MRPVLSNVPWWTQSTCNNWFHWGAFQQSAAILRPLLSVGRQIARGTGGIKCWQNMKDLAAFVHSAELDFVCVNKLGYWLPASLPANWICGEIIGGCASRKIIFACFREFGFVCKKWKGAWNTPSAGLQRQVVVSFWRPASSLASSNPILRVQNLVLTWDVKKHKQIGFHHHHHHHPSWGKPSVVSVTCNCKHRDGCLKLSCSSGVACDSLLPLEWSVCLEIFLFFRGVLLLSFLPSSTRSHRRRKAWVQPEECLLLPHFYFFFAPSAG